MGFAIPRTIWILLAGLGVLCLVASGCTGGGETVISGLGNSSNVIGEASVLERVAKELASFDATPRVSDEELLQAYTAIRDRALQGEPESALVLLQVAARQRRAEK